MSARQVPGLYPSPSTTNSLLSGKPTETTIGGDYCGIGSEIYFEGLAVMTLLTERLLMVGTRAAIGTLQIRPVFGSFRGIAVCGGQKRPNTPVAAIFFGFAPWVRRFAPKVRTLFYWPLGCAPGVRRCAPHRVGCALAPGRLRCASLLNGSSHRSGRLAFECRAT